MLGTEGRVWGSPSKSKCRQRHGLSRGGGSGGGALVGGGLGSGGDGRAQPSNNGQSPRAHVVPRRREPRVTALRCDVLRFRTTDEAARDCARGVLNDDRGPSFLRTAPCDTHRWHIGHQRQTASLPSFTSARRVFRLASEPRGAAFSAARLSLPPVPQHTTHRRDPLFSHALSRRPLSPQHRMTPHA